MRKFPPAREQNEKWSRAMCSLSSALFVVSLMLLWGSLSISRSSHQLATQQESLLLPGFQQLHHPQLGRQLQGSLLASYKFTAASAAAAAAEQQQELEQQQQEQEQQQQQQALPQPLVADVPGYAGPPYILPKLIHQTVKDKRSMSCEVQESIQSWIDMNPGYTHILYDDADLLDFVRQHFPDLLPIYQGLPTNIERTDTWRYLVLHKLGGVYADSDVKCMQPISTWNQEHSFDAALMVGIAKRNMKTGDTREFNQFVMAAMPAHPVLATMPLVIAGNLAASLLKGSPLKGHGKAADEVILARTGPIAFTTALEAYARRVGASWPVNSTQADLQGGVLFGTVRAMPKFVLGTGWDTLEHNMTCEEVKQTIRPEALICHQFFGTWKSRPEKAVRARQFTYGDCSRREGEQQPQQQQQQQLPAATTAAAAAAADRDDDTDSVTMDGGQEPPEDTAAVAAAGRLRGPAAVSYTGAAASDDSTAAVGTPEPELLPVLTAAAAAVGGDAAAADKDTATGAGDVVLTAAVPDDDAADSATDAAESASPASTTLVQQVVYNAEAAGAEPTQGVLTSSQAQEQQQQQGQPLSQEQELDAEAAQQQPEQPQRQQQEQEQEAQQPDEQVQEQEQQLAEQQPQKEQQPLDLQAREAQPEEQQTQQGQWADEQQTQQQQQADEQAQQEQGSWPAVEQQPDQQVQVQQEQQEQQRDEQAQEQQQVVRQQQQIVRQPQQQQQELELQAQYTVLKQQLQHLEAMQQQLHLHHGAVPA